MSRHRECSSSNLRELLRLADVAGLDGQTLARAAGELVAMQLQLVELARLVDRRRKRSFDQAQRIAKLHQAGATSQQIRARLGMSKSTLYRHLSAIRKKSADV